MLPSSFVALVNNPHSRRFPSWIFSSVPISITYRRLTALAERLDEIVEKLKPLLRRRGVDRTKLYQWISDMEDGVVLRLHFDEEWGMILFMLSEMLDDVERGKLRNVSSLA